MEGGLLRLTSLPVRRACNDNRGVITRVALCHCERSAAISSLIVLNVMRLLRRTSSQ